MGGWNPQLDELLAEDAHGRPLTQVHPYTPRTLLCLVAGFRLHLRPAWGTCAVPSNVIITGRHTFCIAKFELLHSYTPAKETLCMVQLLVLDNRGVGRSSMPRSRKAYTSTTMAIDVLCIMVSTQCALKMVYIAAGDLCDSTCHTFRQQWQGLTQSGSQLELPV